MVPSTLSPRCRPATTLELIRIKSPPLGIYWFSRCTDLMLMLGLVPGGLLCPMAMMEEAAAALSVLELLPFYAFHNAGLNAQ